MSRKLKKATVRKYKLWGGPFSNHSIFLSTPGTLTFTAKGQTGYYKDVGWKSLDRYALEWVGA